MARKVIWPLPPEKEPRPPWYTLNSEDKIEDLKERTDGQDVRLSHLESLLRICVKLFWIILAAFAGVVVKEYVSSYSIVKIGRSDLPAASGVPSTAPDYPKTSSRP